MLVPSMRVTSRDSAVLIAGGYPTSQGVPYFSVKVTQN